MTTERIAELEAALEALRKMAKVLEAKFNAVTAERDRYKGAINRAYPLLCSKSIRGVDPADANQARLILKEEMKIAREAREGKVTKYTQLHHGKWFSEGTKLHGFLKFKSYDGEISFEQVCRCGFHTADDTLFMDHVSVKQEAAHD